MSWRAWRPVLPFLVGRHDVFAPTLAGHRGGPPLAPHPAPGIEVLVDVLCDQFDQAGIETAHLVGNSLGGWVALELARRGRARSVLGLSPAGTWATRRDLMRLLCMFRVGSTAVGSRPLAALARNGLLRRAVLSRIVAHPGRIPVEGSDDMVADLGNCPMLGALLAGKVSVGQLAEFDIALCPVKIAWAERDHLTPYHRYGRPMRKAVRGAEFVVLPGVGHVPMYDDPRLVARTILEFTGGVDPLYRVDRARAARSA
jgi:pimeloyl-ACP methyl ester carboxylesterase